MNELLDNYKLFGVIFITILLMAFVVYRFLFKEDSLGENRENLKFNGKKDANKLTVVEQDEKTFQKLNKLLPPMAGSIYFLRTNDMTMVFHKRELSGLYAFYDACKNNEYVFLDQDLEELKIEFYYIIEKYILTFEANSKETSSGYYRVTYNIDALHVLVDKLLTTYSKLSNVAKKVTNLNY